MDVLGFGQDPNKARENLPEPGSAASSVATSFLERLRQRDALAWSDLVHIYHPVVHTWCRRAGLPESYIADVVQEVFRAVSHAIAKYDPTRADASMRGWLFGITQRQLMAFRRQHQYDIAGQGGTEALQQFHQIMADDGQTSAISQPVSDRALMVRQALDVLRGQVEPKTFDAFWQLMVDGKKPADVAATLEMKVATLYVIKGRMMRRLRELLEGDV